MEIGHARIVAVPVHNSEQSSLIVRPKIGIIAPIMGKVKAEQGILEQHFSMPPQSPEEATALLNNYWGGSIELPPEATAQIIAALTNLSIQEMGQHGFDPKRVARQRGKEQSNKRTGGR